MQIKWDIAVGHYCTPIIPFSLIKCHAMCDHSIQANRPYELTIDINGALESLQHFLLTEMMYWPTAEPFPHVEVS